MNTNATAQMVTSGGKGCMKQRLDTDQIAAEAWKKIASYYSITIADGTGIEEIKAAIEKATDGVTKERDDLKSALQTLMKAVEVNMLCGIPEIKTVDDVIRGMRTVADKLVQVSESRAAHASEPRIPEQSSDNMSPAAHASDQKYDDLLPVCLHQAIDGIYHLLDRHNDEIATFDRAIEVEDMERIVRGINQIKQRDTQK